MPARTEATLFKFERFDAFQGMRRANCDMNWSREDRERPKKRSHGFRRRSGGYPGTRPTRRAGDRPALSGPRGILIESWLKRLALVVQNQR
jgi:hypothetical protein